MGSLLLSKPSTCQNKIKLFALKHYSRALTDNSGCSPFHLEAYPPKCNLKFKLDF